MIKKLNEVLTPRNKSLFTDLGLLLLRVSLGLLMAYSHGYAKVVMLFSNEPIQFPDPIGVGVVASLALACFSEFICSFLLVIGFYTRLVLVPLVITMLIAYFVIHGADPLQKKELALMYLIGYLVLSLSGPGRFSADHTFTGNR